MRQCDLPGTPSLLRAINDRAALELLLDRGPLTRAQLGELTGLSKVTASQMMERLEERELVAKVGEIAGGRGPNAQLYAIVPSSAYVIGVEVGTRRVVAAAADITGETIGRATLVTDGAADPVRIVQSAILDAAKRGGAPWDRVRGVVVGTPGPVDPATGDLSFAVDSFAVDLPRWHRGLLATLRAKLNRPVRLENEVNLAALAEAKTGAARGVDDFVLLWIGRAVGLAVVLGGQLHRGAAGAAGEIGYLPVPRPAPAPAPAPESSARRSRSRGVNGSFRRTVNAQAVRALARACGFRAATAAGALQAAIRAGGKGEQVLDELAYRVALGVAATCVVLDPTLVVLAGEVGGAGGVELAGRVQRQVARLSPVSPRVVATEVTADGVLYGALLTALDEAREEIFTFT